MKMRSHLYIQSYSDLVGKKFGIFSSEFNLKLLHIHNPRIAPDTAHVPNNNEDIRSGIYIAIEGDSADITRLKKAMYSEA